MSDFATMNGVNRTRAAIGGGLGGSQRRPVVGMMGSQQSPYGQAMGQQNGAQMETSAAPALGAYRPMNPANQGTRIPQQPTPSAVPQQAPVSFDPNDPRNAALAGYMNGT